MKKVESIKPTGMLADMIEEFKKDLLLKDLAARIPYGVKAEVTEAYWHRVKNVPIEPTIKVFTAFDYDQYVNGKYYQVGFSQRRIISVKPYLRPMSSMTDVEKEELSSYMEEYPLKNVNYPLETEQWTMTHLIPEVIDFYYSHHIDFRNLISLQKALEAPKGMYNFEEED